MWFGIEPVYHIGANLNAQRDERSKTTVHSCAELNPLVWRFCAS